MIIDPGSLIGKMRLRVGDYGDLPIFYDEVYQSALDDCNQYLPRACVLVAQYILASLTCQTHQKLAQIEVYGNQYFEQYLTFVKATILNPNLMTISPVPYYPVTLDAYGNKAEVPLVQFQNDWNKCYAYGTQTQQMSLLAKFAPAYSGFDGTNYF